MEEQKKQSDFIFGIRAVIEAIKADAHNINKLYIKKGLQGELFGELKELIKEYRIPFQLVPIEKLNRLTRKNHQGVVGFISPIPFQEIEDILPGLFEEGKTPFILILDKITDVRNFGAIARTAECSGVDAIVVPALGSAQINRDAVKTSAGALLSINVCRSNNLVNTIKFLKNSGLLVLGATEKTDQIYHQSNFSGPIALVLGSEDKGLSSDVLKTCDELVKIPIAGKIESLNVSVAAGVLMYEVVRQRSE